MLSGKIRFLLMPSAVLLGTLVVVYIVNIILPFHNSWFFYLLPLAAFSVYLVAYRIVSNSTEKSNLSTLIFILFGLKFFSFLILAIIFFAIEKSKAPRLIFICIMFISYMVNTIVLIRYTLKFFKTFSKQQLKSD